MKLKIKIFVLIFSLGASLFAHNQDSIVVQESFPLSDPRNPNCPCHKLQQLADDEYKKIQKQDSIHVALQAVKQIAKKMDQKNTSGSNMESILDSKITNFDTNIKIIQHYPQIIEPRIDNPIFSGVEAEHIDIISGKVISKQVEVNKTTLFYRQNSIIKKYYKKVNFKRDRIFHKRKSKVHQLDTCFYWNV